MHWLRILSLDRPQKLSEDGAGKLSSLKTMLKRKNVIPHPHSQLEDVPLTKQKTPHTQTQQNTKPEQTDLEADQNMLNSDDQIYADTAGAQTGSDRSGRVQAEAPSRK